jgi:hypothetical protein
MPQKITMNLQQSHNHNSDALRYVETFNKIQALQSAKNTSLKTPMIGRIHNIRPGCGSCGR